VTVYVIAHGHRAMSLEHSPARVGLGRAAFTISEFCEAHRISRSKLYQLWAAGTGPVFKTVGTKKIITVEAAAEWRAAPTEDAA
jgi:hypothetical protein